MKAFRWIVGLLALIGLASIGVGVLIVVSFIGAFFWIIVLVLVILSLLFVSFKEWLARGSSSRQG